MRMRHTHIENLGKGTRFKYRSIVMYRFVAGDVLRNGETNMDSVKKCLEFVVGKSTPTSDELLLSDFNMNGQIDLADTLNVLQIAEASKKPIFISGKNITIDKELVKGNILGILVRLNTPNTLTFSLEAHWMCVQNNERIYVENISQPSPLTSIGTLQNPGASIVSYEIVFEYDGIMYYIRD